MTIDWVDRSRQLTLAVRNLIDGNKTTASGDAVVKKYSPRDGELLYEFNASSPRDIDDAVAASRRAVADGRWSHLALQQRKGALFRLASLIEAHRDELALLECLDVGKPISDALAVDIPIAATIIRYNAEAADKLHSKLYAADASSLSYQLRRPVGVVAGLIGWNFPLVLAATKAGPALAAGNCILLKPSELTSLSATRLAELALEAGVPPGVFNVVHGGPEVGHTIARHGDVDLLSFTGSSRTGKRLLVAAGESNMKRLILECGGKAPNIVFDDCPNLASVAENVVNRAFWNQAEVCSASSRLLVQESIREELLAHLTESAAAFIPGDPLRPETTFGALVSASHKQKVLAYITSGQDEGARIVHQALLSPPFPGGFYVCPTVFDQVNPNHAIARDEIFGPVLSVLSFQDEEEAIRLANSTVYGLTAIVWTKSLGRAHRMSGAIQAGSIVVNATDKPMGGPSEGVISSGGHKESGIGVEGGLEGLESYTTQTAVQFFV